MREKWHLRGERGVQHGLGGVPELGADLIHWICRELLLELLHGDAVLELPVITARILSGERPRRHEQLVDCV